MATVTEQHGVRAVLRGYRMSASKVREVLDLVRGKHVAMALDILASSDREAARTVGKLLASAIANAANNHGRVPDELFVSVAYADEGATMKRFKPRARGSASKILKRTSHITIVVDRLPQAKIDSLRAKQAAEADARRSGRRQRRPQRSANVAARAEQALAEAPTAEVETGVSEPNEVETPIAVESFNEAELVSESSTDDVQAADEADDKGAN
ncbi:MAG: 50S ribosomal protein L22 [Acidimicrobiaceae bacterium]|nr:50S ribosomal protein L22 [Acidimicrobiaceae bacterium]